MRQAETRIPAGGGRSAELLEVWTASWRRMSASVQSASSW
jgi:hypothetical protein